MSRPKYLTNYQHELIAWFDTIPLSRPIHNIEMDFADGILIAEIIYYFFPEYIDVEMLQTARNMSQRAKNWRYLSSKVLPKINFHTSGTVIRDIINEEPRAMELFLICLREKLESHIIRTDGKSSIQWKAWRSFNADRYHLPQLFLTPRQTALAPGYGSSIRSRRLMDSYADEFDDVLKAKDEQNEILRAKLKRCEKVIQAQNRQIQELEEKIEMFKSK